MPAAESLPTVDQLVRAFQGGLLAERREADNHDGSTYDYWNGVGAVLWRRQAERDQEEFRAIYFSSATGQRLDYYMATRFPETPRLGAQRGTGVVRARRASAAAGAGTFLAGTRIAVSGRPAAPVAYYRVAENTGVFSTDLLAEVPIEAAAEGPASQINVVAGERDVLRFDDGLWDNTWEVAALSCGPGRARELDPDWKARARAARFELRPGYESAIIKRMKDAGAATVVLFRSDFRGDAHDQGLNRIYVGDANFQTTDALLLACRLAVDSVCVCGAANQVLPLTSTDVGVTVDITLWDSPERFNLAQRRENARLAIVEYFERRENPFVWDLAGVRGAIQRVVEDIQTMSLTTTLAPPTPATLFDAYPLPRFRAPLNQVTVNIAGPA